MTQEDLREAANVQPFTPFRIFLADGTNLRVSHPDGIAIASRTAMVVVPDASRDSGDRIATLAIRHITKIERDEPAGTGK